MTAALSRHQPANETAEDRHRGRAFTICDGNQGRREVTFKVKSNAYRHDKEIVCVRGGDSEDRSWSLHRSGNWYDFTVTIDEHGGFSRRFAGRVETGRDSFSDPAMGGTALGDQD